MSGFVCIWHLDHQPVHKELLQRMTDAMAYRGTDRGGTWFDGEIGMGHRLLMTTFEAEREHQPSSLDGNTYIVTDARIDDRDNLKRELLAKGCQHVENATDSDLILHAYAVWGDHCVEHLLGDFSFVIWDKREQQIFCARDHWGIKLLYYAHVNNTLIISNELNVVRLFPEVRATLNDLAIADFLLFDCNLDLGTTTFADIQRLRPAHTMTVTRHDMSQCCYWVLPHDQEVRFKREEEYVERFKELLDRAITDRLRQSQTAVFLSGGLDSSTIAAAAKAILEKRQAPYRLQAYTAVYDWLIPCTERYYAQLVAEKLDIPFETTDVDDTPIFTQALMPEFRVPEPFQWPLLLDFDGMYQRIATKERVAFVGEDGDGLMLPATGLELARAAGLGHAVQEIARYMRRFRRRPTLGLGIQVNLKRRLRPDTKVSRKSYFPPWLNPTFAQKFDLRAKWEGEILPDEVPKGTLRPRAYRVLTNVYKQVYWESYDPGVTNHAMEVRMPLMDLRLATYLLALPTLPWCVDKYLFREAARGILPDSVRVRPKTVLAKVPVQSLVERRQTRAAEPLVPVTQLLEYIIPEAVPKPFQVSSNLVEMYSAFRVLRLNDWLKANS